MGLGWAKLDYTNLTNATTVDKSHFDHKFGQFMPKMSIRAKLGTRPQGLPVPEQR